MAYLHIIQTYVLVCKELSLIITMFILLDSIIKKRFPYLAFPVDVFNTLFLAKKQFLTILLK